MDNFSEIYKRIYEAVSSGDEIGAIELLRLHSEEMVVNQSSSSNTWLIDAAEDNLLDLAKFLVNAGYDIDGIGLTPISSAVGNGHFEMTKWFIEQGADIHYGGDENDGKGTLLFSAATKNQVRIAELLIQNGIDINKTADGGKCNALSMAIMFENKEMASYLESLGLELPPQKNLVQRFIYFFQYHVRKFLAI